ncbi:PRC-barrel domain-containing protein [Falsiroseomonas sp. E2-1-a20]|uniref:PRC-barrel domain-containing protein n=1 Tax=Falsiroseomonas sp. E2-1-a20 TaxID=3239300 RepID=UPI003F384910
MQDITMRMAAARHRLLLGAATAALGLAMASAAPAAAQQAQQGVTPSQPQAAQSPLQRAAQELRVAHQQLGDASGDASPQAIQRARQALDQMTRAMADMPQDQRGPVEQRVAQARDALGDGDTVPAPRARSAIEGLLAVIPAGQQGGTTRQEARTGASATPQPAQSGGGTAQPVAGRGAASGLTLERASNLVGTNVVGANGRDAGEIENLLIDGNGQVRAAVVEWGGFLGIGARRAVVPIEQLAFGGPSERVRMELTRAQLEALPRYETERIQEYGRMGGWADGVRAYR